MIDRTRMGQLHESFAAEALGGRPTRGSGNQWSDPNDTRDNHHVTPFALSVQCKSTLSASHAVTREILSKLTEEAGGELPCLALRWYPNERLDHLAIGDDWAMLRAADLSEVLAMARRMAEQDAHPVMILRPQEDWPEDQVAAFRAEAERMQATGEWWRLPQLKQSAEGIPFFDLMAPGRELPEEGSVVVFAPHLRQLRDDIDDLKQKIISDAGVITFLHSKPVMRDELIGALEAEGQSVVPTSELEVLREFQGSSQLLLRLEPGTSQEETEKLRAAMEEHLEWQKANPGQPMSVISSAELDRLRAKASLAGIEGAKEALGAQDTEDEERLTWWDAMDLITRLREENQGLSDERERLGEANALLGAELQSMSRTPEEHARRRAAGEPPSPLGLSTVIVYSVHTGGEPRMAHQGVHVGPFGQQEPFSVSSVRVEPSHDNKPRLFVNDNLVRRGELYVDGRIVCRVGFGEVLG